MKYLLTTYSLPWLEPLYCVNTSVIVLSRCVVRACLCIAFSTLHTHPWRRVSFYVFWCQQQCVSVVPQLMLEWKNECVKEYVAVYVSKILKRSSHVQTSGNISNMSSYFSFVWFLEKYAQKDTQVDSFQPWLPGECPPPCQLSQNLLG